MAIPTSYVDRCIGVVLGTYVGDALGAPFEGETAAVIKEEVPLGPFDMFDGRQLSAVKLTAEVTGIDLGPSRVGQYTDDTECVMALAESLVEVGGLNPEHAALTTAYWWCRPPSSGGYSAWTFKKLAALCEGTPYRETGKLHSEEGSYGNGGCMRIAPIGLAYRQLRSQPEALRHIVADTIVSTHDNAEAVDGSLLIALAVARCCTTSHPSELDPVDFLKELEAAAQTPEMVRCMGIIRGGLEDQLKSGEEGEEEEGVYCELDRLLLRSWTDKWFQIRASDAAACVLYIVAKYSGMGGRRPTDTPERCLVRVIALGGDTDTLAAMAGAVLGALHGYQWIPDRWMRCLEIDPIRGVPRARELGAALAAVDCPVDGGYPDATASVEVLKRRLKAMPLPVRHEGLE